MLKIILSHDFKQTAINNLWKLFSGPLLLLLIPVYLTVEEQGFWFTFISLAALVIFADMGFSNIILQFSAHEFAYLKFNEKKEIQGPNKFKFRLASLFRFALKWSLGMAIVVFPIILMIGVFLFNKETYSEVEWFLPWLIYGVASIFVFINSMTLSFIEGCDSVGDAQQIRFFVSLINVLGTVILLIQGYGLYALSIALILSALSGVILIYIIYGGLIHQLLGLSRFNQYRWNREVFPLLGKYAISWSSGYFMFQVFAPVAFYFYGAEEAGRVGMSVAIFIALFSISNIWMTIIVPKINMQVEKQKYLTLNHVFWRHLLATLATFIIGVLFLFSIIFGLQEYLPFEDRLVSANSLAMLAFGWFFQIYVNSAAIYMRAHKREPLMWFSLGTGVYIGGLTLLVSYFLPIEWIFVGFITSYIWGLPLVHHIFKPYYLAKQVKK